MLIDGWVACIYSTTYSVCTILLRVPAWAAIAVTIVTTLHWYSISLDCFVLFCTSTPATKKNPLLYTPVFSVLFNAVDGDAVQVCANVQAAVAELIDSSLLRPDCSSPGQGQQRDIDDASLAQVVRVGPVGIQVRGTCHTKTGGDESTTSSRLDGNDDDNSALGMGDASWASPTPIVDKKVPISSVRFNQSLSWLACYLSLCTYTQPKGSRSTVHGWPQIPLITLVSMRGLKSTRTQQAQRYWAFCP